MNIDQNGGSHRLRIPERQPGRIVKVLSLAAKNVIHTFHFQSPYGMTPHGSDENGLNWDDGHIPYRQLETVLSESIAGFAHIYSYGVSKCKFLKELLGRPVMNLEDFGCPDRKNSSRDTTVSFHVTLITISVAQRVTHIPSTNG